jgi:hypothetical protein
VLVMVIASKLRSRLRQPVSAVIAQPIAAEAGAAETGTAVLDYDSPRASKGFFDDPPPEEIEQIIWSKRYAKLPEAERKKYSGWKNWHLWWALFVGIVLAIYAFFIWFRFQYPIKMLPW